MRDRLLKEAVKNTKVIIKNKGALDGSFFLIDGATDEDDGPPAGLAVTLRSKDEDGTKVKSMGMKLRALNKRAPFTWGRMTYDGSKLVLLLEGKKLKDPKTIKGLLRGLSRDG
jgi:hypothetical protein